MDILAEVGTRESFANCLRANKHLSSIPICAISLALLSVLLQTKFPNQHRTPKIQTTSGQTWLGVSIRRIDILGTTLLLAACVLIVTAMQQAAEGYSFASRLVLPMLICAGVSLIAFLVWQRYINKRTLPESVFPWQLLTSRIYMGMIL